MISDEILTFYKKIFPSLFPEEPVKDKAYYENLLNIAKKCNCPCHTVRRRDFVPCCEAVGKLFSELESKNE